MLIVRTRTKAQTAPTIELSTTFRFWNTGTPPPESMGTTTTDLEHCDRDFGTHSDITATNRDEGAWERKSPQIDHR